MRLIDADKINFNEVFMGASDFARDTREAAQSLIDSQPTIEAVPVVDRNKVIDEFAKEVMHEFTVLELHDRYPTVTDYKIILHDVAEKMKGGE